MVITPPTTEELEKIWELRLYLGDLGDITMGEDQYLSDDAYLFFIRKYTKDDHYNFRASLYGAAVAILAQLVRLGARQRIGQEEIYGKELVDSWMLFLKELQKPKNFGVSPTVYIGGVVRDTVAYYATSPEFIDPPFYKGQQDRSPYWRHKRLEYLNYVKEPEEHGLLGLYTATP